jgi:hypothetical protein
MLTLYLCKRSLTKIFVNITDGFTRTQIRYAITQVSCEIKKLNKPHLCNTLKRENNDY